jgi:hypothetical protein
MIDDSPQDPADWRMAEGIGACRSIKLIVSDILSAGDSQLAALKLAVCLLFLVAYTPNCLKW